jgi:hypothetical protein
MDQQHILELALQVLQRQKAGIEEEIEALRNEMKDTEATDQRMESPAGTRRGRKRSANAREAQAQKMREYWAKKRAQEGKPAAALKPAGTAKVRSKTEAQKKALGLAMKKAWAKRKAAEKAKSLKG